MGVKDLWSVFTPHANRKPISELRGKTVAIDLAGWVCESLNVVDYFVHPRHHLKNLFFRTCYLIWEDVTPVFVLEGTAPKLKSQVIAKRNEIQFRGVKPKDKDNLSQKTGSSQATNSQKDKGRTRFNHVLKQCESLLNAMGVQCVQGPGEAEAYCAFLNKVGLVDGVISQDSDCFAYGAIRVFRNFSVSTQGAQAAQGGAVDIYDIHEIGKQLDFGQHKVIAMALLCGCDYCPDGIGGIGRDGVLKLFNKYKETEILERLRCWRRDNSKYTALEMRVDDKSICVNCGHMGRTQSHTKNGCGVCRTKRGCDESLWKEERLSIKAELAMRKKALNDADFPNEEIINEFLSEPNEIPTLNLSWKQPNIVKFIKKIGHLLQWPEIYCFQKFLPILTRWQVQNANRLRGTDAINYVELKEIVKKRMVKGVPSLEVIWTDAKNVFTGLIPNEQLEEFVKDHPKGIEELWTTIEPTSMLSIAYVEMVEAFNKSKEKPAKVPKKGKRVKQTTTAEHPLGSLENLQDLVNATNDIAMKIKSKKAPQPKGLQLINKFFKKKLDTSIKSTPIKCYNNNAPKCSTPLNKLLPSDLDSDSDNEVFDMSDIVNGIVHKNIQQDIKTHGGRCLFYEPITKNISLVLKDQSLDIDDLDILVHKRRITISNTLQKNTKMPKLQTMDDSFDVLVNKGTNKLKNLIALNDNFGNISMENCSKFNTTNTINKTKSLDIDIIENENNRSYFFDGQQSLGMDEFEKVMDHSYVNTAKQNDIEISD